MFILSRFLVKKKTKSSILFLVCKQPHKVNMIANIRWKSCTIFTTHSFSPLQLAWQWTLLWMHYCGNAGKMRGFSMAEPNNLLSLIFGVACCGVKWIRHNIRHIYWLVSQTGAWFVHDVPCHVCHCLFHFSGHRTRSKRRENKSRHKSWGTGVYDLC